MSVRYAGAPVATKAELAALNVQKLLGKFSSAFCGMGLSILLGFDPLPRARPLQTFWGDNRIATILLLAIVGLIALISFAITQRGRKTTQVKHQVVRVLRTLRESMVEIIVGFLAGLFLGIGSAPSTIPVLALIRSHPPIGIALGAVLLVVLIVAPLIGAPDDPPGLEPEQSRPRTRIWLATSTSFVSTVLLFSLVGLVTIRPAWCPTSICPAPQLVVVTNPHGVNDGIMEAYYLAEQSDTYALTQDPAAYNFNNLPSSGGALELGVSTSPYRAVIGIHSLQRDTRYGLIIDGVDLLLDKATPLVGPVNVFLQGAGLNYKSSIWNFNFEGEAAPTILPTTPPATATELEVGGSDELSIQVTAHVEAYLQFRLQVRYHQIVGGSLSRTLIVPHEFAVYFVAPAHWRPYIFSGGKMVPQSSS